MVAVVRLRAPPRPSYRKVEKNSSPSRDEPPPFLGPAGRRRSPPGDPPPPPSTAILPPAGLPRMQAMARCSLRPPIPRPLPQAPPEASAAWLLHRRCRRKTRLHSRPRLARPHPRRAILRATEPQILRPLGLPRLPPRPRRPGQRPRAPGRRVGPPHRPAPLPPRAFSTGARYGSITEASWFWHAAVMCADAEYGHVHGDCFASPFKLVLMCKGQTHAFACVYNSTSGVWGNIISTATTARMLSKPGILIGNAVHWLFRGGGILVFDVETQSLGVIDMPAGVHGTDCDWWSFQLLRTGDDGSLGLAVLSKLSIQLWKRQSNSYGVVEWVLLQKTVELEGLFPRRTPIKEALMVGYDEDSNEIVLASYCGVFMLQIESMKFRTVCKSYSWDKKIIYPYRNFYTAGREVGWKWVNLEL